MFKTRDMTLKNWLFDIALVMLLMFITLCANGSLMPSMYAGRLSDSYVQLNTALTIITTAILSIAVLLRRFTPPLSMMLVWVAVVCTVTGSSIPGGQYIAVFPVLYSCAAYGGKWLRWTSLIFAFCGAAIIVLYSIHLEIFFHPNNPSYIPSYQSKDFKLRISLMFVEILSTFICAWVLGILRKLLREFITQRQLRATAESKAEAARIETEKAHERNQLAREMHDVVAHSLVVVAALSDGCNAALKNGKTDTVANGLTNISNVSREALADVRRLLAMLRHEQSSAPAQGLTDLPALYEQVRQAGADLRLSVTGSERNLTPGAALVAYRVIQESLTNAMRHGDKNKPIFVDILWDKTLNITVANALPSAILTENRTGHGLRGMQERTVAEAGAFNAGVESDNFIVRISLPIGHDSDSEIDSETVSSEKRYKQNNTTVFPASNPQNQTTAKALNIQDPTSTGTAEMDFAQDAQQTNILHQTGIVDTTTQEGPQK